MDPHQSSSYAVCLSADSSLRGSSQLWFVDTLTASLAHLCFEAKRKSKDIATDLLLPSKKTLIWLLHYCLSLEWHIFKRLIWQILALALPGVILSTVLTACVFKYEKINTISIA